MSPQDIVSDPEIKKLMALRKEAFTSLDETKIRNYMARCDIQQVEKREVFWKGVHMARAAMVDIPMELREKSIDWMIENSTLFRFIPDNITQEETKELLMHFYEVKYGHQLDS